MICIDLYFAFFCATIVQYFLVYWEFSWGERSLHGSRRTRLTTRDLIN